MYSKRKSKIFGTVKFRLTLLLAGLFSGLSLIVFLMVYLTLTSTLQQRIDTNLLDTTKEFDALYRMHGVDALRAEFKRESEARGVERAFFLLASPKHEVLATSNLAAWGNLAVQLSIMSPDGKIGFRTVAVPGHQHKVRLAWRKLDDGNTLDIGYSLQDNEMLMRRYRRTFTTAFGITLLCGGIIGWFVAKRAMSGVERVTQAATRIDRGNITQQVPMGHEGDEIDTLVTAFNNMLKRIQMLVTEIKEVTDNIAHDLRSPITRLRGIAETTLTGEQRLDEYQDMAAMVIEESDHLVAIINTMLEIARVDAAVEEFSKKPVDMSEIVRNAGELFQPFAEDKGICLEIDVPPEPLIVSGDGTRLQRVIANLLDNAIKYSSNGKVRLMAKGIPAKVLVSAIDSGMGISEKDLVHIFERFYRGDQSRATLGNGLGLSLAQAYVRAHGGEIAVKSFPGKGSIFTVSLPRSGNVY